MFTRACAQCHGGPSHPSTSTPDAALVRPVVGPASIASQCPRPETDGYSPCPPRLERNAPEHTKSPSRTAGFKPSRHQDPGRLLLTGQPADLRVMDVTQLRGISRTAPYFHNNSAATLEDVLDHYDAFFRRVARLNPGRPAADSLRRMALWVDRGFVTAEERPALLAYFASSRSPMKRC